ncbi:MAG: hypothetical protein A3G34_16385 [Candidatus Lindowbacteria bacterium RIFCSPLOWO2_12_FULL_62_27]|nr:MAG: hypothetical protein A3G34_16385 [Candidatus Lindowbacteria bacterium RIFCSPLOWO2_12_FULL_62_27]
MTVMTVPRVLREKMGDDGVEGLVEFVARTNGALRSEIVSLVDDKFARRLSEEIGKLRVEMHDELGKLRAEFFGALHSEIGKLRAEMHDELGKLRAEIIKWMFLFWLGQAAVVLGLFLKFR